MRLKRILSWTVVGIAVVGVGAYAWAARHPELEAMAAPDPSSFDGNLVEQGRSLAAIGNCAVCHTREGGEEFEGGRAMPTPFGTIYTTNITPDPTMGIGAWSEEAFIRAMHQGIDRHGNHLYPAFPYDRYTKVSEDDIRAIYAYLMSDVDASDYAPPANDLPFPFNIRLAMEGWNLLFLNEGRWEPDPDQDDEWNRGAYLVEGLGHCGSCHSPRNMFGAELDGDDAYAGGYSGLWHAPALNAASPAPIPWGEFDMVNYLLDGWDQDHGIAAGPMTPVVDNLYNQSEDDAFAIAAYVLSLQNGPRPDEEQTAIRDEARAFAASVEWDSPDAPPIPEDARLSRGADVFEAQCSSCHVNGSQSVPLGLSSTVNLPTPANLLLITLDGIRPPQGALGKTMPSRDVQISDNDDMVALLAFIRDRFSDEAPWEDLDQTVRDIRESHAR